MSEEREVRYATAKDLLELPTKQREAIALEAELIKARHLGEISKTLFQIQDHLDTLIQDRQ